MSNANDNHYQQKDTDTAIDDEITDEWLEAIFTEAEKSAKGAQEERAAPIPADDAESLESKSNTDLIKCLHVIHYRASHGVFEPSDYQRFLEINAILDESGVNPVDRFAGLQMFDPSACRQTDIKNGTAPFMLALQVIDLRFVWRWCRGRKTFGRFAGIFEGETFNLSLGEEIARVKMKIKGKDDKGCKLDLDALNLEESREIQRKLVVLRDDATRQWQDEQRQKADRLNNDRLALEGRLREYRDGHAKSRLTDESIRVHGLVFVAMKRADGSHAKAIDEYKKLTGETRKRDFIRDKAGLILELSHKHEWDIKF